MFANLNHLTWRSSMVIATCLAIMAAANQRAIAKPFNCTNCNLKGVDLSSKQYLGAKRANSDLRGANLESANLSNNVFAGSDFRGANLRKTILTNTFFTNTSRCECPPIATQIDYFAICCLSTIALSRVEPRTDHDLI